MPNMQRNTAYWQEKKNNTFAHSTEIYIQSKIKKKICTIYFQALLSFKMFADPSFQVKQHLLSTDLLRWFQGSPGDLKSIKWGSTW